jgi:RNA polymerase sigma factor (sigma-70 family)
MTDENEDKTEEEKRDHLKALLVKAYLREKRYDNDVKNNAMVSLLSNIEKLKSDNIPGLFYRSCKNQFIDSLRKDNNRKSIMDFEAEIITENDLGFESSFLNNAKSTSYTDNEIKTCLKGMFTLLNKGKESVTFTLYYLKGYSMPETAKKLNVSKMAICKRLKTIERKIEKSPELMALIDAKTYINSTGIIDGDKNCYGVSVQKTSVNQNYGAFIEPGDIKTIDIDDYKPQTTYKIHIKSYLKQIKGAISGNPLRIPLKDIGNCLKPLFIEDNQKYNYDEIIEKYKKMDSSNYKPVFRMISNKEHGYLFKNAIENGNETLALHIWKISERKSFYI